MSPCRSDYIFTDKQVGVRHVVSEDSDHFSARLAVIHGLHDLDDFEQPTRREVRVSLNHPHTPYELFEIGALRSSQWISLKKRNDRFKKIVPLAYNELVEVFFVVVIPAIAMQTTHTEVPLHHLQTLNALCALSYHKLMRYLEAGFVASTILSMRLFDDVDRKASLSVDKTSNPTNLDQSFLLIVRS
jgi:hypothetical protein